VEPADLDLAGHHLRFLRLGRSAARLGEVPEVDLGPHAVGGAQPLGAPLGVVGDHRVGGVQHPLGGAVVLLQDGDPRAGVVALEVQDVAGVGAAPRVDGLVVVAHHAEVLTRTGQQARHLKLGAVGVLVLVDHQVVPALPALLAHLHVVAEEPDREEQEVVEVRGPGGAQRLLVARVDVGREHRVVVGAVVAHAALGHLQLRRLRVHHAVLPVGDLEEHALHVEGVVAGGGDHVHLLRDDALDQRGLVAGGVDGELLGQADALAVVAQHARPQRVEGGEGDALRLAADDAGDALAHLQRRLVGEGHRQDPARIDAPAADQVRDAEDQRARLAGARPGQHQHGPLGGEGGLLLLRVQLAEILRKVLRDHFVRGAGEGVAEAPRYPVRGQAVTPTASGQDCRIAG
jgi:hypothetical protein